MDEQGNNDGSVTKDEHKDLFYGDDKSDEFIDEHFKMIDENGDGKYQFDEYFNAANAS